LLVRPQSKGIENPKAWAIAQLKKGYCAAQKGFKSREEQQPEAKLQDTRARLERIQKLREQRFNAEFDIWFGELSEKDKKAISPNFEVGTAAARALLRAEFANRNGFQLPGMGTT